MITLAVRRQQGLKEGAPWLSGRAHIGYPAGPWAYTDPLATTEGRVRGKRTGTGRLTDLVQQEI
jgi:hypothetical protein